jgi:NAD(P)-dependent dehydrogenase (short-subunit alcohol dehydrogenase family)
MSTSSTDLSGRRVIVTGAASGIGRAVAQRFSVYGASIAGLDLTPGEGIIECDVSDEQSVESAFATIDEGGPITDLVHCAGIASYGPFLTLARAEWDRIIGVNLRGSFLVGQEAARRMNRGAAITFLASQGGLRGSPQYAAYCASKFGVIGLMQSMSRELAPSGIRVNAVCPGGVRTPMADASIGQEAELRGLPFASVLAEHNKRVPLGAEATADQIADVCVFLASTLASHVAGASIVVNGAE